MNFPEVSIITTWFPRVNETWIYDYVKIWRNMGGSIKVYPLHDHSDELLYPSFNSLGMQNVINKVALCRPDDRLPSYDAPKWAADLFGAIPWLQLPIGNILSVFSAEFDSRPNQIVHAHYLVHAGTIIALLKERCNFKAVLELHGMDIFKIGRQNPKAAREVIKRFDAVIVNCGQMELTVRDILRDDARHCQIVRINHGIDITKIAPPISEEWLPKERIEIVSAGRLVEKKGIKYLIDAFCHICQMYQNLHLTIIGDGYEREALESIVQKLGLQDRVSFIGKLTNQELINAVKESDIFVLPCIEASSGDMDGIPNVIQEAQACCVPVVSTWLSGIPEIVDHGLTGILVNPKDSQSLANAIEMLIVNPDLRRVMGDRGRKKVTLNLDMNQQIISFSTLYKGILGIGV